MLVEDLRDPAHVATAQTTIRRSPIRLAACRVAQSAMRVIRYRPA